MDQLQAKAGGFYYGYEDLMRCSGSAFEWVEPMSDDAPMPEGPQGEVQGDPTQDGGEEGDVLSPQAAVLLEHLRPDQRPFFRSAISGGVTMLQAVAGAGKTEAFCAALIAMALNAINAGIKYGNVVISQNRVSVDVCNKRVRLLLEKLFPEKLLDGKTRKSILEITNARTLHSVALQSNKDKKHIETGTDRDGKEHKGIVKDLNKRVAQALEREVIEWKVKQLCETVKSVDGSDRSILAAVESLGENHATASGSTSTEKYDFKTMLDKAKVAALAEYNQKHKPKQQKRKTPGGDGTSVKDLVADVPELGKLIVKHVANASNSSDSAAYDALMFPGGEGDKEILDDEERKQHIVNTACRMRSCRLLNDEWEEGQKECSQSDLDPVERLGNCVTREMVNEKVADHDLSLALFARDIRNGTASLCSEGGFLASDEAPDTTQQGVKIFARTAATHPSMFAGDGDQHLNSFAQSPFDVMGILSRDLEQKGIKVTRTTCTVNGRCSGNVVDAANVAGRRNNGMTSSRASGDEIFCAVYNDEEHEAKGLARMLSTELRPYADHLRTNNGAPLPEGSTITQPGDIVVLLHKNVTFKSPIVAEAQREMRTMGLPSVVVKNTTPFSTSRGFLSLLTYEVSPELLNDSDSAAHIRMHIDCMKCVAEFNEVYLETAINTALECDGNLTVQELFDKAPDSDAFHHLAKLASTVVVDATLLERDAEPTPGHRVLTNINNALIKWAALRNQLATLFESVVNTPTSGASLAEVEPNKTVEIVLPEVRAVYTAAIDAQKKATQKGVPLRSKAHIKNLEELKRQKKDLLDAVQTVNVTHPLGAACKVLVRDGAVKNPFETDEDGVRAKPAVISGAMRKLIEKLDGPIRNRTELVFKVKEVLADMSAEVDPKKCVLFTTVFSFKGDERNMAWVSNIDGMTHSWLDDVNHKRRFANLHLATCKNRVRHEVGSCDCPAFNEKMDDISRELKEERRRLVYVALTRARNKLFVSDIGGLGSIMQDLCRECKVKTLPE